MHRNGPIKLLDFFTFKKKQPHFPCQAVIQLQLQQDPLAAIVLKDLRILGKSDSDWIPSRARLLAWPSAKPWKLSKASSACSGRSLWVSDTNDCSYCRLEMDEYLTLPYFAGISLCLLWSQASLGLRLRLTTVIFLLLSPTQNLSNSRQAWRYEYFVSSWKMNHARQMRGMAVTSTITL